MDSESWRMLETIGYYVAAYIVTSIVSAWTVRLAFDVVSTRYLTTKPDIKYVKAARLIGIIERLMYVSSILVGQPAFIGVWLVLKAAGEWRRGDSDKSDAGGVIGISKEYTVFLIGNAFSLIAGVASGLLMTALLPPFPSLEHWQLPLAAIMRS